MTIVFNGKKTDVLEGATILDFVTAQQLNPKTIVAELNFEIIKEAEWSSVVLKENDTLEVLNFVGGG